MLFSFEVRPTTPASCIEVTRQSEDPKHMGFKSLVSDGVSVRRTSTRQIHYTGDPCVRG